MNKQHDTKHDPDSKHPGTPAETEAKRKAGKENNAPRKTVGTRTPGLKKDEETPIARERKARKEGNEEETHD